MPICFRCNKSLSANQAVRWPLGSRVDRCLDCVLQFARDEHRVDISADLLRRLALDLLYDDENRALARRTGNWREPEEYVCNDCGWSSTEMPLDGRCPTCAVTPCDCDGVLDCPNAGPLGAITQGEP